jgi:hypothetical protein
LVVEQAVPHVPQLVSEYTDVSQPFDWRLPSQFAYPATHVPVHDPAVQALPLTFVPAQATPHAPQLLVVVIEVSQPSDRLFELQSA